MNISHILNEFEKSKNDFILSEYEGMFLDISTQVFKETSKIQVFLMSSVMLYGYSRFGKSFFSELNWRLNGRHLCSLFGFEESRISDVFKLALETIDEVAGGEIFEDWSNLNHTFAKHLTQTILSYSAEESREFWLVDEKVVTAIQVKSYLNSDNAISELKEAVLNAESEVKTNPFVVLTWRLQTFAKTKRGRYWQWDKTSADLSTRLATLIWLIGVRAQQQNLFPSSPFTTIGVLKHWQSKNILSRFDIDTVLQWLFFSENDDCRLTELVNLLKEAESLNLLFQVPVRISPKRTEPGYGLTLNAIKMAEPFQHLIDDVIVRPGNFNINSADLEF